MNATAILSQHNMLAFEADAEPVRSPHVACGGPKKIRPDVHPPARQGGVVSTYGTGRIDDSKVSKGVTGANRVHLDHALVASRGLRLGLGVATRLDVARGIEP